MVADTGATATMRDRRRRRATRARPARSGSTAPEGTLRGSVLLGSDRLSLDRDGADRDYPLHGQWFVDGFAGTMGELMTAIAEDREPENSAAHAAATVRLMLAARESAERGPATPVALPAGRTARGPAR